MRRPLPGVLGGDRFLRRDRRLAVGTDLPERLERRLAARAGLLEARGADGTDEIVGVDIDLAHGAASHALAETRLHLLYLELALVHLVQILGRTEKHVDDRAEERKEQRERRGGADQPRVLDAAASVLVNPVRDREPEDGQEEEGQILDHVTQVRVEEATQ